MQPHTPSEVPRREQLLQLLADGEFHSGERMAEQLSITRAAVWKAIKALRELGIELESQHQGYRLANAIDLYDAQKITAAMPAHAQHKLARVDTLFSVDSTNRYLTEHPATQAGQAVLCVGELQQAGRGRRGRTWIAPFGSGICMSIGWLFDSLPPSFSALTLVVGVAMARVLHRQGAIDAGLKWPNDVLWHGHKLAGVLTEMRGEPDGAAHVVIGIGMNLHLPDNARAALAAQHVQVADLHEVLGDATPTRNALVAGFTTELIEVLDVFSREGFAPFTDEWQSYDVLKDAAVNVLQVERIVSGVARGVTTDGTLLVETAAGIQSFVSGEVSLRATQP